jgi:ferredoxin-nitrite reductase
MFMACGDYKNRGRARSRFIATQLGDDEFRKVFHRYLTESKQYDFHFLPQSMAITKQGDHTAVPQHSRIHQQKQQGLYYVEYHPLGGTPNKDAFVTLLQYLDDLDDVEIRLSPDETIYIINLTGAEASKVAALTEGDAAKNDFEKSTCCIGAAICQQGLRDSQGMFIHTVAQLRADGVRTDALPSLHISGCPSSCTTHIINPLGLRGAAKKINGEMKPAFTVYAGGNSVAHEERLAVQYGTITEEKIPAFLAALNETLTKAKQPFAEWYAKQEPAFAELVKQYE